MNWRWDVDVFHSRRMNNDFLHGNVRWLARRGWYHGHLLHGNVGWLAWRRYYRNVMLRNVSGLARWHNYHLLSRDVTWLSVWRAHDHGWGGDDSLRWWWRPSTYPLDGSTWHRTSSSRSCGSDADVGGVVVGCALFVGVDPGPEAIFVRYVADDSLGALGRSECVVAVHPTVGVSGFMARVTAVVTTREVGELVGHRCLLGHQLAPRAMVLQAQGGIQPTLQQQESG